jgi:polyisoprenoid-binding protein YceI
MKKLLFSLAAGIISTAAFAQSTWNVDAAHSNVQFTVTHLVISEVTGNFKVFDGKVVTPGEDFNNASVDFTVDVASINTDNADRDKHLKSDDFFNAEKFPKMTFKSKSFKKVDGKKYKLTGDLTIRDVTKTVTFDVVYNGTVKDPWGNTKAGFKLNGQINRKDFGLKWNAVTEAGGAVVSDEVIITSSLEFAKQK